jgi:hypothetical protein
MYKLNTFLIIFEEIEDIKMMKNAYQNYEQLIDDLIFDDKNIIINNNKAELKYVNI